MYKHRVCTNLFSIALWDYFPQLIMYINRISISKLNLIFLTWTYKRIGIVNHNLPLLKQGVYFFPPHFPNGSAIDLLDDNTFTHIASIVYINISVLMPFFITHTSGGEWWERKNSWLGNRLPSLIIQSNFSTLLPIVFM